MTTNETHLAKAFERFERFCKKFCTVSGRVDIITTSPEDDSTIKEVLWSIRGKIVGPTDVEYEEENYYGTTLLNAINTMPK